MSAPTTLQPAPASYGERLILVIEDDVPIAEALALIIEDLGYQAVIATDGLTGLASMRTRTSPRPGRGVSTSSTRNTSRAAPLVS